MKRKKRISDDDMEFASRIGSRITALRKKAGYSSQEKFSFDVNIPRALYSKYEQGVNLTIFSLNRILKFHNISVKAFFEEGFEE